MLGLSTAGIAACSGDDEDSGSTTTVSDPGPNSTVNDPGPNDTASGPDTISGVVTLTTADACITLATTPPSSLRLDGYTVGEDPADATGRLALIADDERGVLAHSGDQLVVSGNANGETDACGAVFVVESLNSVIPTT
jgi:hypothetical protein